MTKKGFRMSQPNPVVFPKGTHYVETRYGHSEVIIPRDITLAEIKPALSKLALSQSERVKHE